MYSSLSPTRPRQVAAFAIRVDGVVLASSTSAGGTLGLVVADEVFSGAGFFGLLYPSYTLVMDR